MNYHRLDWIGLIWYEQVLGWTDKLWIDWTGLIYDVIWFELQYTNLYWYSYGMVLTDLV